MVSTHGYDAIRPEIRAGALVRVRSGSYVPAADLEGAEWERQRTVALARCVAVAERFTTPFAFGLGTAATLYEWIDVLRDHRLHVMQSVKPGAGQPRDVVRHVSSGFRKEEIAFVAGLPVTPREVTIVDCARLLPPDEALAVVDGAFRVEARMSKFRRADSEVRQEELRSRVQARLSTLGAARGVRQARMVLQLADGFAANPAESRVRWIALRQGLPVPVCQHEFWVDGKQYFVDALWMSEGPDGSRPVIAEFDGALKYRGAEGAEAVVEEKKREDAIRRAHRATFVRLDWPTIRRSPVAFREILAAFPPGGVPELTPRPELQRRPSLTQRSACPSRS